MAMTDQQVVNRANQLAREFYTQSGCNAKVGFRFDLSCHPQEQLMWRYACVAFEMLLNTDPDDAVANLSGKQ